MTTQIYNHSDLKRVIQRQRERRQERRVASSLSYEYDDLGGQLVVVSFWFAPKWWTESLLLDSVCKMLPARRCEHSHDCCGHSYPQTPRVLNVENVKDDEGKVVQLAIVHQKWLQNV